MNEAKNPYRAPNNIDSTTVNAEPSLWRFPWVGVPSVWTFLLHLPAVDPIYFQGVPLLLRGILPGPLELLVFFLAQWPVALMMSIVIASQLSSGNKYLGFGLFCLAFAPAMIVSQLLWEITPFSWR